MSHPTRVRGLKLLGFGRIMEPIKSHPTRVRGLKHPRKEHYQSPNYVAPHAGAWIETAIFNF